jgi:putative N-acetylmannosamine-6-phosphate epimerase
MADFEMSRELRSAPSDPALQFIHKVANVAKCVMLPDGRFESERRVQRAESSGAVQE